jgi:NTE family protein
LNPQLWTWLAGYHDAHRTLRQPEVPKRPVNHVGVFSFDLAADERE